MGLDAKRGRGSRPIALALTSATLLVTSAARAQELVQASPATSAAPSTAELAARVHEPPEGLGHVSGALADASESRD